MKSIKIWNWIYYYVIVLEENLEADELYLKTVLVINRFWKDWRRALAALRRSGTYLEQAPPKHFREDHTNIIDLPSQLQLKNLWTEAEDNLLDLHGYSQIHDYIHDASIYSNIIYLKTSDSLTNLMFDLT